MAKKILEVVVYLIIISAAVLISFTAQSIPLGVLCSYVGLCVFVIQCYRIFKVTPESDDVTKKSPTNLILTVFIPLYGFIFGIVCYNSKDEIKSKHGKDCLALSIFSGIIEGICYGVLISSLNGGTI